MNLIHLLKNPAVINLEKKAVEKELATILLHAYTSTGQNAPEEEVYMYMTKVFINDVRMYFYDLTLAEIAYAVSMGIRGEYIHKPGEFCGLTNVNLYRWLKSYRESAERSLAVREVRQTTIHKQLAQFGTVTDIEKRNKMIAYVIEAFEKGADFTDYGNAVYDFLDSEKIIDLSAERKREIFQQTFEKMASEERLQRVSKRDNFLMLDPETILDVLETSEKQSVERVKAASKRVALKIFFDDLREVGYHITDLLPTPR